MTTNVCIDLFAGVGGFSAAFEDSDRWDVLTVEIDTELSPDVCADVMELRPADLLDALQVDSWDDIDTLIVLASPPCTVFSFAGNHDSWENERPVTERAREHVALVHHTLGLIHAVTPDYWFLENPRGRMRWVLGKPTGHVTYCQYGKDYQKPTDLWGNHPATMYYDTCKAGSDCHATNTDDDGYSTIQSMTSNCGIRSKVPYELSETILQSVEKVEGSHPTLF